MSSPDLALADLPASICDLLWTVERDRCPRLPLETVAAAVMERGSLAETRWLLGCVGLEALRAVLPQVARRLSPRSLALWACLLELPPPAVTRVPWVAA
jgi:hypothetical protein